MTDGLSRRQFLGSLGVVTGGLILPPAISVPGAQAAPVTALGFGGGRAVRAAMHVHGSWSEGAGSWEAQLVQASTNGYDLLYVTDHDMRSMALNYITSLSGIAWDPVVTTGSFKQKASTVSGGSLRVLAESASSSPCSLTLPVQAKPLAFNRLRTSISGLQMRQTITSARLTNGARYEVVLPLSYHPAMAGRPAGQYQLVYRFGVPAGRFKEGNGLTGVVGAPTPTAGSVQTLIPQQDVAAIWPEMVAIDNCTYLLSFAARSPTLGAVCDVSVASVTFTRSRSAAASVIADQAAMLNKYRPRFPDLDIHATTEVSKTLPDMNPFGIQPWLPDYSTLSKRSDIWHQQVSDQVHAMGGVIAYNHPFGYNDGPLYDQAGRNTKRRQVFAQMQAVGRFSADLVEVGYNLRGNVDALTHIALWDTFSRNGDFLTGNGTSDDHSGKNWKNLNNGYATGVWTTSTDDAAMIVALSAGRAFVAHAGRWPGDIDLLVDNSVPMGAISVSTKNTRSLSIWATNLPSGGAVQVIGGPVDYAGAADPGTSIVKTIPASGFSGNVATLPVGTTTSKFLRAQVLTSSGQLVGTSNPVWLLRSAPPGGIPPARRVT